MGRNDNSSEVAIIGAGPYGLAAAAHLRAAGVETRIFGEPMEFWERHMPRGMLLRSSPKCTSIGDPDGALTLDRFHAEHGPPAPGPLPLDDFVHYGHWFQERVAEDLDRRRVMSVEPAPRGFRLRLRDGEQLEARRVVVATGIGPFACRPPEFDGLPAELASHSSAHAELGRFAGQRVVVIGGGQSALEAAALLQERRAEVEVIVRAPAIFWLKAWRNTDGAPALARLSTWARRRLQPIVRPKLDIMGPRFVTWLVAWPRLFRSAPLALQRRLTAAAVRPAGASWLVPRLAGVRLTTGRTVVAARPSGAQLLLRLDDASERRADHLLLATGYRVDVRAYEFLSPGLRATVRVRDGFPELSRGFESSVPGLHFVGASAAGTFGPICRFVIGSRHAARALARHVARGASDRRRRGTGSPSLVRNGPGERVAHAG
jgi:cation diffusion facilitator CzcD-associated flavoprotein CzcO